MSKSDEILTIHNGTQLPIGYGIEEAKGDFICLDPSIGEGKRLLSDKDVTIAQLFALLRQFVIPVCSKLNLITTKLLKRGVNVNDLDLVTGFSLLHYGVRAAAISEKQSLVVIRQLLSQGADPSLCSLYEQMNSLHLSAYFNLPSAIHLLLTSLDFYQTSLDVNSLCGGFEWGSSLHIAISLLHVESVQALLENGANDQVKNNLGKTPVDCLPLVDDDISDEDKRKSKQIKELITKGRDLKKKKATCLSREGKMLQIGSRVLYSSQKTKENTSSDFQGTLRYIGQLHFNSDDLWVGIELDTKNGKNNGSIDGNIYFKCRENHGIFVKPSQVRVIAMDMEQNRENKGDVKVGDYIEVSQGVFGFVRFVGNTHFAPGKWVGIELEKDDGKVKGRNDGSIGEKRYFQTSPSRGIFISNPQLLKSKKGECRISVTTAAETPKKKVQKLQTNNSTTNSQRGNERIKKGIKVKLNKTNIEAYIRFIGETEFSPGKWIGLELTTPDGKNNGTVKGKKYFSCKSNHGLMVRYDRVSIKQNKNQEFFLFKKP